MTKKKNEEVKAEEIQEVNENVTSKIADSLSMQEYLNQNRDELFKEIPNLITADFFENPSRVMLTVGKKLSTMPEKEFNGVKIVFDQMILGGVVTQRDSAPIKESVVSMPMGNETSDPAYVFGKECLGPHNATSRNTAALEAWQKRNPRTKVVG